MAAPSAAPPLVIPLPAEASPEEPVRLVLAAPPGLMRNALLTFLEATVKHAEIYLAGDLPVLLELARSSRAAPLQVIVDLDLGGGGAAGLLPRLLQGHPGALCIALVNTLEQQAQSLAAGAHQALLKGFLDESLREAIVYKKETHA